MRRCTLAVALVGALAAALRPAGAERYAVIAGNDQYPNFSREQWLEGCANDARLVHRHLVEYFGFQPQNVRLLINDQVTRAAVLDTLENWLVVDKKPGDLLLFYWSGHGKQLRDDDGDEKDEDSLDEVLAPYDFRLTSPDTGENAIRDDELNRISKRAGDNRTFVAIFDCCHSGTGLRAVNRAARVKYLYYEKPSEKPAPPAPATRGVRMRDVFFEPFYVEPKSAGDEPSAGYDSPLRDKSAPDARPVGVALIAAARANELAAEASPVRIGDRTEVHGALTLELIKALGGEADYDRNGQVTFGELEGFLSRPIVESGNVQHPVVEIAAPLRDSPLFPPAGGMEPSLPPPVALPVPPSSSLPGLQPLRVAVAPYDAFPDLAGALDPNRTSALGGRIDAFLADLASAKVVERVALSDAYEELVLYGVGRGAADGPCRLGALDPTAQFSLRADYSDAETLLTALRGELNRAYTVMNLTRLRQPAGSRDRLEIAMLPAGRTRLRLGEEMAFRVRADRSGYLSILNVTADGQMLLIYPNALMVAGDDRRRADGFIEGGETVQLPQEGAQATYKITRPVGREFIKAFLTDQPPQMFDGRARPGVGAAPQAGVEATGSILRGLTRGLGTRALAPRTRPAPVVLPRVDPTGIDFGALAGTAWAEDSLSFVTVE